MDGGVQKSSFWGWTNMKVLVFTLLLRDRICLLDFNEKDWNCPLLVSRTHHFDKLTRSKSLILQELILAIKLVNILISELRCNPCKRGCQDKGQKFHPHGHFYLLANTLFALSALEWYYCLCGLFSINGTELIYQYI